LIDQILFS